MRPSTLMAFSIAEIYCNYKLQAITPSRHIPVILYNSHIPILIVFVIPLCWHYPDNGYLLLQNITFQATSKTYPRSKVEDTVYPFCDFLLSTFVSPTSTDIKKYIYVVILPLFIAFDPPSHLPTRLSLYKHYPRFSISMPFRLFAFLSNLTFGTYNDVTGNQTNTYNGKYYNSYNLSSLANEWY